MTPPLSVREALAAFAKASSDYNKAEDAEPGYIHRPPEWWSARHDEAESALIAVVRHDLLTGESEGPWEIEHEKYEDLTDDWWVQREGSASLHQCKSKTEAIAVRNALNALEAR